VDDLGTGRQLRERVEQDQVQTTRFEVTVVTGGRGGLTWQAHCEFIESF
jgi:hypothetical protein